MTANYANYAKYPWVRNGQLSAKNLCNIYAILLRNRVSALISQGIDSASANTMTANFADVLQIEVWMREEAECGGQWPIECQPPHLIASAGGD